MIKAILAFIQKHTINSLTISHLNFHNKLTQIFNENIPLKKVSSKTNSKPWITKSIGTSLRTERILYSKKLANPTTNNITKHKKYKHILEKNIKAAKRLHTIESFNKAKGN